MHHQFDDQDSSNYQRLPKHAHFLQLRKVVAHTAASSPVSCCLQQVPVRWHRLLHWMIPLDDAIRQAKNGLRGYLPQVLQADEHLFQRFHLLVEQGCEHAFATTLGCLDRFATVLPTNGGVRHHPL